jgi:small-conductance mechanosensitive channel
VFSGIEDILAREYFGNTLSKYLFFAGALLAGILCIRIFRRIVLKKLISWSETTSTSLDNFLLTSINRKAIPLAYFGLFYLLLGTLKLKSEIIRFVELAWVVVFSVFVVMMVAGLIDYFFKTYSEKKESVLIPRGMITIIKGIVWVFGLIFILDNLGFKVSTIIAGLGIGGVAVAMASQTILKDLFNYFVIIFDKPFLNGDFIEFDDYSGSVEHIGIKTTRLRTLGGEQLIISNSDLTDSKIRNFRKMEKRTVLFTLGVGYGTGDEILRRIPSIIEDIIKNRSDTEFMRAHFRRFSEFSLDFEIVYTVNSRDFARYLDIQQEINLEIKSRMEKEGVDLPYPTQMVLHRGVN